MEDPPEMRGAPMAQIGKKFDAELPHIIVVNVVQCGCDGQWI